MTDQWTCERCEDKPGRRQVCPGDGRYHHHGGVHTADEKLLYVCDDCRQRIADEWTALRLCREVEREAVA